MMTVALRCSHHERAELEWHCPTAFSSQPRPSYSCPRFTPRLIDGHMHASNRRCCPTQAMPMNFICATLQALERSVEVPLHATWSELAHWRWCIGHGTAPIGLSTDQALTPWQSSAETNCVRRSFRSDTHSWMSDLASCTYLQCSS